MAFPACQKDAETPVENADLIFLETQAGGCNNQNTNSLKSSVSEKDTIFSTMYNHTPDFFVGKNYICCAPFSTEVNLSNDSIFISITDDCPNPYTSCYCKCNCYYTWNFLFTGVSKGNYYLKVLLTDPRATQAELLFDEWILITLDSWAHFFSSELRISALPLFYNLLMFEFLFLQQNYLHV